ncbi:MAG: biotin--[acetyl-CoA-carboxylase] ligase [Chloroflexi bacterium 13_1_40CM_2_68_14]|nr:MAG: biotin--[acetyl-CoA-carboxylase] ligase [Deltaproteobacteria bacterium 13_1_40CM_3_69_14]OLD47827.1 MAG: biotin--[acetyl-CoA-carboxylase] ligase [Chloroflexi bacterium 13_1_40CM_2_68_14]
MPSPVATAGDSHWTDLHQDAIVLALLLECADDFVAGGMLCDKLDVPRAELLKRIDSLRARGYVIHTRGGLGYRLVEIPDQLGEAQIAPLLASGELGRKIHHFEELESTNDEAHRLAEAGALHGEVVVADFQTRGRGRRGRSWVAPRGKAVTFSVVLRPAIAPVRAPEITIAAAVAAAEAAREMGAASARIKWPNDVECKGRKIAGLLTELRAEPDRVRHAVLGVGFNVSLQMRDFPEELRPVATSLLLESGERQPRPLVCARLLEHVEEWLSLHETEGFGPVADRWRELSSTLGRRVRITGADPIEGDAVDLAEDGALLVRTAPGALVRVLAGDVEHCTLL